MQEHLRQQPRAAAGDHAMLNMHIQRNGRVNHVQQCILYLCLPWFLQEMQEHLRQQPALLPEILRSLFEIILFEENSNQWSLSRPMLSLILINEPVSDTMCYMTFYSCQCVIFCGKQRSKTACTASAGPCSA
jgi:hypothetical protein